MMIERIEKVRQTITTTRIMLIRIRVNDTDDTSKI